VRPLPKWLVLVGVLAAVSTGCASHERPDADPRPSASATAGAPDTCSTHIDDLIEARIVPGSDRDYAFQMCELNR